MTGSYLYFIGALAVFTHVMEGDDELAARLPRRFRRYYWIAGAIAAVAWPVGATILVVVRLIRMLRNG